MSLFDRILTEARNEQTFKSSPGTDAFLHTDRWRGGRRNQSPATWFRGKNKRFPVWQQRASAAGTLRAAERFHGKGFARKIATIIKGMKSLKMCPSVLPGCPPRRNHGAGGPDEYKTKCQGNACNVTKKPADAHTKYPWPFGHASGPKWDKDWTALGHEKGSHKMQKQSHQNKRKSRNEDIEQSRFDALAGLAAD